MTPSVRVSERRPTHARAKSAHVAACAASQIRQTLCTDKSSIPSRTTEIAAARALRYRNTVERHQAVSPSARKPATPQIGRGTPRKTAQRERATVLQSSRAPIEQKLEADGLA